MENIEAAMKRIPPHSTEAEQAVLGAMLMNKDAITVTSEILAGQDFYQTAYGILFDAMTDLFKSGRPVDLITLQEYLKTKDVPPEVSSMEFARDLLVGTQTSANVKYYAEIVKEKSVLRSLIKLNEETANACYLENEPLDELLERTEKRVFELAENGNSQEYVPIKQVVLNALDVIEKASKTKGNVTGIPTGFIDLDYKLSGLQRSDLVLIAARPSMGKTAFVLNIAQHVAFRQNLAEAAEHHHQPRGQVHLHQHADGEPYPGEQDFHAHAGYVCRCSSRQLQRAHRAENLSLRNSGGCRKGETRGTSIQAHPRHHGLHRCRRQRPHEGDDSGELQPHPCRGAADCRRRVAAYPIRPGTATPVAEQVGHRRRKEKIRSSVQTGLRIFLFLYLLFCFEQLV